MTLRRLRDLIRMQAGIKGQDTLVGLIDEAINDGLKHFTARKQFPELKVLNVGIAVTVSGNPTFTLPTDLQHFLLDRVRYADDNGDYTTASSLYSGDFDGTADGPPIKFSRTATTLTVWPQETVAGDKLYLDYYKYPTPLVNDADVFSYSCFARGCEILRYRSRSA
jgi:hypothetical protein